MPAASGGFDRLWPSLQHLLLLLVPVVGAIILPWASSDLVPTLGQLDPRYAAAATAAISLLTLLWTPLTKRYGVVAFRSPASPEPGPSLHGSEPEA
jgi:hypothetical protein